MKESAMMFTQITTIARYELLMHWRRRSLPALLGFVFFALIGFSLLSAGSLGAVNRIVSAIAIADGIQITERDIPTGALRTYTVTGEDAAAFPAWLLGVDLERITITFEVIILVAFSTQALFVALLPILADTIPFDKQVKVRELLDALPIGRAAYLMGKLGGAWIGLLIGLPLIAACFAIYATAEHGALDPTLYILVWLAVVIPGALVASGWTILANTFTGSRRAAVMLGLALIPLVIVFYMSLALDIHYTLIGETAAFTDLAGVDFNGLTTLLISKLAQTTALYLLTVPVLGGIVWLIARQRA
jgi:hypothetical protein